MKKIILSTVTAFLLLAGCADTASDSSTAVQTPETTARTSKIWYINSGLEAAKLPDDAAAAFEDAHYATAEGDEALPIALLARKTSPGTEYEILCYICDSSDHSQSQLLVLDIYQDPSGSTSVNPRTFELSDYAEVNKTYTPEDTAAGAYEINTEYTIQGNVRKQFMQRTDEDGGTIIYDRVAVLGADAADVNEGKEYAVLCFESTNDQTAAQASEPKCWTVLTVDDPANTQDASILSVYEINPGAYAEQEELGDMMVGPSSQKENCFDYKINDTIQNAAVSLHEYKDGQWTDTDFIRYDREVLKDSGTFSVTITDTSLTFADLNGTGENYSIEKPLDDWSQKKDSIANITAFLQNNVSIQKDKEIILWYELYGKEISISGRYFDKNNISAESGRILTIRFSS